MTEPPEVHRSGSGKRTARFGLLGLVVVGALAALFALGYTPRLHRDRELVAAAKEVEDARPRVNVVRVSRAADSAGILLPGSISAIEETPIHARAEGYLRRRLVDIGDRVRAGQLLAEIETPELDQQIRQARAAIEQARAALGQAKARAVQSRADLQLAEVTNKRWSTLVAKGVISRQAGDEKQSAYDAKVADVSAAEASVAVAQANVSAAEASLQRLLELKSFQRVTAPFAGVITARNVDTGALISAGSASAKPMFSLAAINTLRIFVDVPQSYVPSVKPGLDAEVFLQEFPKRVFHGRVARTANALDQKSHTLLTEVQVPNGDGALLPGMYAQVKFVVNRADPPAVIPSEALVIRSEGPHVAVVDDSGAVHMRKVAVGRDYGARVEITNGLSGSERIVMNPGDDLKDGAVVEASEIQAAQD